MASRLGLAWVACVLVLLGACGGDDGADPQPSAGAAGVAASGASAGMNAGGASAGTASTSSGASGEGAESSEAGGSAGGHFDEPETTFTLPFPGGEKPALYHPDVIADFPEVDFSTLDRLYIPAGEYRTVLLGGLPERSPERPLVITNLGGQVKVGGAASNYVFSMNGGKNWVLSGRYDAGARTGDADYRGHAGGAYAHSQGTYGIFIDDAFSKEGLLASPSAAARATSSSSTWR